jgi:inosine-uridine nucleoside N-ribohydrolase
MAKAKIPVILDTDIGTDIDDTWALAMMLKSPELDVRLIVSDTHDTVYRSRVIAKLLQVAGRTDIPVGVGISQKTNGGGQAAWVEGYRLQDYPGAVRDDGVQAIIDTIMASPKPITLICIGPVPNIAVALRKQPAIAGKARFVGMHGSINRGYGDGQPPAAEYNVKEDPASCRVTFEAPWLKRTITPLDTCGRVRLDGPRYQRLLGSPDPLLQAVLENYRVWATNNKGVDPQTHSTILFDTVAVHLAFSTRFLTMKRMGVSVTDTGMTVADPKGPAVDVALDWKDLGGYFDYLVERLLAPVCQPDPATSWQ